MRGKNTIIINGRAYDAVTGKPADTAPSMSAAQTPKKVISDFGPVSVRSVKHAAAMHSKPKLAQKAVIHKPRPATAPATSHAVHQKPQKSQTLHRKATARPEPFVSSVAQAATVNRSPMIRKFAEQTAAQAQAPAAAPNASPDTALMGVSTTPSPVSQPTGPQPALLQHSPLSIKEQLIKERLDKIDPELKKAKRQAPLKKLTRKSHRIASVATMSLALAVLGGYLTYVNMPNLSVRVASARAGVTASFPEYKPDGYHFAGPVAYQPGEVTIRFKSNSSTKGYELTQVESNWDSQAVLDNFVIKESSNYLTYSEQGLTVYTYNNKAAWVNGGVLYTLNSDSPLSSEQVLRIAASM